MIKLLNLELVLHESHVKHLDNSETLFKVKIPHKYFCSLDIVFLTSYGTIIIINLQPKLQQKALVTVLAFFLTIRQENEDAADCSLVPSLAR